MTKILVVTNNKKKLSEIEAILKGLNVNLLTLNDFPPIDIVEDGTTFFENAFIKASTAAKKFGVISLGEDSGCVER